MSLNIALVECTWHCNKKTLIIWWYNNFTTWRSEKKTKSVLYSVLVQSRITGIHYCIHSWIPEQASVSIMLSSNVLRTILKPISDMLHSTLYSTKKTPGEAALVVTYLQFQVCFACSVCSRHRHCFPHRHPCGFNNSI